MANKNTKAQSNEAWLSQKGQDGTLTFVNSGGSNDVAWSDTDPNSPLANVNSQGQTYAQGTIHNMGGSGQGGGFNSSGYTVYDGAQNLLGHVAGDGTPFILEQTPDYKSYVGNTDLSGLTESQRQALLDAAAKLKGTEGYINGSSVDDAVNEVIAGKKEGLLTDTNGNVITYGDAQNNMGATELSNGNYLVSIGNGQTMQGSAIYDDEGNVKGYRNTNYGRGRFGSSSGDDYYSKALKAEKAALERAYAQSLMELEADKAQIPNDYYEAERMVTGTKDREKLNMNEQFAALGLNTGARGQAAIAMNNVYQGNIGALEKQKMAELADIEAEKAKLTVDYQNAIAEAVANNELAKAQQLYSDYLSRSSSSGSTSKGMTGSSTVYNNLMNNVSGVGTTVGNGSAATARNYTVGSGTDSTDVSAALAALGVSDGGASSGSAALGAEATALKRRLNAGENENNWIASVQNAMDTGLISWAEANELLSYI